MKLQPCPEKIKPSYIEMGSVFQVVPPKDSIWFEGQSLRKSLPVNNKLDLIRSLSRFFTLFVLLLSGVGQIRYRIRRVPDKKLEDVRQLIKDKYNKGSRLPLKEKLVTSSNLKPIPKINPIPKSNVNYNGKVINNLSNQRYPLIYNIPRKKNIVNLQSGLMKDNFKSKLVKEVNTTQQESLPKPNRFTEDSDDDRTVIEKTKESTTTDKPQQPTTQSQKIDTQIEKAVVNHSNKSAILHNNTEEKKNLLSEDHFINKGKFISAEDDLNNFDYDEIDDVLNKTSFYKPEDQMEDISSNNFTNDRNGVPDTQIIDNKNETLAEDELKLEKEARQNEDERPIVAEKPSINLPLNVRKITLPLKEKKTKIIFLVSPKTSLEQESSLGESKVSGNNNKHLSSQVLTDKITFSNNKLNGVPKSSDLENEKFDVIEIIQHNITEVVERKAPSIDDSESSYVTSTSNSYRTQTNNFVNDKPDVTYVQTPYEYPYTNYIQDGSSYYKKYPNFNSFERNINDDASNKIWRSWIDTKVLIKTSSKNPDLSPSSNYNIPKKLNYNNFAYKNAVPNMYTSYPCYVYPNNCYASTNGYYNGNAY
ncbi:unnamed protein product [Diatraea saccharalis]|uniref:Uncharacterized protein n=1 Tax=Diatraea saccharalis TaxID=40085 RepID=A0A9N9WET0_9NEOP|nr:unnamed protein product [Diatraea saccharalis]